MQLRSVVAALCVNTVLAAISSEANDTVKVPNANGSACRDIVELYSPLGHIIPRGFRPADIPRDVAKAPSRALRRELKAWQIDGVHRDFAAQVAIENRMKQTCNRLGYQ
jgi:hypothetical protein